MCVCASVASIPRRQFPANVNSQRIIPHGRQFPANVNYPPIHSQRTSIRQWIPADVNSSLSIIFIFIFCFHSNYICKHFRLCHEEPLWIHTRTVIELCAYSFPPFASITSYMCSVVIVRSDAVDWLCSVLELGCMSLCILSYHFFPLFVSVTILGKYSHISRSIDQLYGQKLRIFQVNWIFSLSKRPIQALVRVGQGRSLFSKVTDLREWKTILLGTIQNVDVSWIKNSMKSANNCVSARTFSH